MVEAIISEIRSNLWNSYGKLCRGTRLSNYLARSHVIILTRQYIVYEWRLNLDLDLEHGMAWHGKVERLQMFFVSWVECKLF